MDEDKSSILYLPSNVASERYVSNTPSHFKIPLVKPLNFCDPHNWEVSLSELYFPSLYYNICRATTRPPRPSSTAECLHLIARLRGEQASAASWEPRPPFEVAEMD